MAASCWDNKLQQWDCIIDLYEAERGGGNQTCRENRTQMRNTVRERLLDQIMSLWVYVTRREARTSGVCRQVKTVAQCVRLNRGQSRFRSFSRQTQQCHTSWWHVAAPQTKQTTTVVGCDVFISRPSLRLILCSYCTWHQVPRCQFHAWVELMRVSQVSASAPRLRLFFLGPRFHRRTSPDAICSSLRPKFTSQIFSDQLWLVLLVPVSRGPLPQYWAAAEMWTVSFLADWDELLHVPGSFSNHPNHFINEVCFKWMNVCEAVY